MEAARKIHIGILTPHSADRPHFKAIRAILPEEVSLTIQGLDLAPNAALDGRTEEVLRGASDLVRLHGVQGLMVTGAPMSILNPDVEKKLAETINQYSGDHRHPRDHSRPEIDARAKIDSDDPVRRSDEL